MGLASTATEHSVKDPLWIDSGDKYHSPKATRIFLAWCGCSSIKSRVQSILHEAGLDNIDKEKISLSRDLQRYIELNHLQDVVPAFRRGTYAVLHNPQTGSFLDLNDKSRTVQEIIQLAAKLKKDQI